MLRSAASKVMWVGRATVFLVGLAVIIALTVGVVSQASAQINRPAQNVFMLGATNTVNAMSSLVGSVADSAMLLVDNNGGGPALDLQVEPGQAPMKVNSGAKVDNLNADTVDGKSDTDFYAAGSKVADSDKLDGKDATEIGVNGLEKVSAHSVGNSDSAKTVTVACPSGKLVVGTGFAIHGGARGNYPNAQQDVVVDEVYPAGHYVFVEAKEVEPTSDNWRVGVYALCATAAP